MLGRVNGEGRDLQVNLCRLLLMAQIAAATTPVVLLLLPEVGYDGVLQ